MPQIKDMSTADIERYLAARKELEAIEGGTPKAKTKPTTKATKPAGTKKRKPMTAEAKAKLAKLAKARWAKVKKAGKTRL
jgi:hypothetical protein